MTPLLTTAVVAIAATLLGRRARKRTRQLAFEESGATSGLPPLDPRQSNAVMHDAEKAAIRAALGDKTPPVNPHPRGTRANIIWETHFHSVLMDWEGDAA